jgi:hypothetical protein
LLYAEQNQFSKLTEFVVKKLFMAAALAMPLSGCIFPVEEKSPAAQKASEAARVGVSIGSSIKPTRVPRVWITM